MSRSGVVVVVDVELNQERGELGVMVQGGGGVSIHVSKYRVSPVIGRAELKPSACSEAILVRVVI